VRVVTSFGEDVDYPPQVSVYPALKPITSSIMLRAVSRGYHLHRRFQLIRFLFLMRDVSKVSTTLLLLLWVVQVDTSVHTADMYLKCQ
jgi:hypothetical protein